MRSLLPFALLSLAPFAAAQAPPPLLTRPQMASDTFPDTPLGRYQKIVYDTVTSHLHQVMAEKGRPPIWSAAGTVRISVIITPTGQIKDLKIIQNSSNEVFANLCARSLLETKLPPIPANVASVLPRQGLSWEMWFTSAGGQANQNQLLTDATLAYIAGEYDRAIDLVDSALAVVKPDKAAPALLFRGGAYLKKGELDKAERDLNEVTVLDPTQYRAYIGRAIIYNRKKDQAKALRELDSISALKLNKPGSALNGVAWIRATFPEPGLRDGNKATQEALRACEESQWQESGYIDTLAAAYAETGDFERAVKFQEQALGSRDQPFPERQKMQSRLALYRDHKPYREDPLDH
jgi:tetratricopeptide (TPR) repeat protein